MLVLVTRDGLFTRCHLSGDAYIDSQSGNVRQSWILALSLFCPIYPLPRLALALGHDAFLRGSQAGRASFLARGSL